MNQHHILYLCALLMDMAIAGATFAISRRAAELHETSTELGLLGATWIGVYAAFALVTGRISDRVGRRRMAVTGCVIAAIMSGACALTTNVMLLLVLSGMFGVGLSCFWPSIIAWLGEGSSGAKLARRLTNFSVAWNIGLLLGFAYTGALFQRGTRLPFYVSAAAIVLIAALLLVPARADTDSDRLPLNAPLPEVPKGRGFRKTAWMANFAVNFATGGVGALFPQLATTLGISPEVHSGLNALGRGAALAAFVALQLLVFWRTRLWPLWVAQLMCAAGILWIGVANATWMFAVAWIVCGAVSGYTYQASIFFTLEEISEKGKGSGFHEAIVGSGMFFGPLFAGWVGDSHSLRAPYFFCAWALVVGIALQIVTVALRRKSVKVTA
jgi:MFS family permease